jgi:phage-related protein
MFGWLKSAWNWAFSGVDDLWHKAISVFQTLLSYVNSWIDQFTSDIFQTWQYINSLVNSVERWVQSIQTALTYLIDSLYNQLIAWVDRQIASVANYIGSVAAWATGWINRIYNDVRSWLTSLENWVINSIWTPLYNLISGALRWIQTNGAWVLYLLTHPDQLALILGRYILASWLNLGRKYAKPAALWIVHSMISAAGDVAGLMEDFITSIL